MRIGKFPVDASVAPTGSGGADLAYNTSNRYTWPTSPEGVAFRCHIINEIDSGAKIWIRWNATSVAVGPDTWDEIAYPGDTIISPAGLTIQSVCLITNAAAGLVKGTGFQILGWI